MARLMGKAVQERIHYEQCNCGKYCRKERQQERKRQRRIEKQRMASELPYFQSTSFWVDQHGANY